MPINVLVTGATGPMGRLVMNALVSDQENFRTYGLVRSMQRAKEAFGEHFAKFQPGLVVGDVTDPDSIAGHVDGKDALIVLTCAVPKLKPSWKGKSISWDAFYFEKGGEPELVNWLGAKHQIDLAKKLGVKHVILVGSMGTTLENHPLNQLGNILKFTRKSEQYLIASGVPYTIVNPTNLRNNPPGEQQLLVGRNDELFSIYSRSTSSIQRADVARILVSALTAESAQNKIFDVIGRPKGEGIPTAEVSALFARAGSVM